MIRSVPYQAEVMAGIASLLGVDAADLQPDTAGSWARRINAWVRKGSDYWQWKELQLTEERAFRQVRSDLLNYLTGEEVYDLDLAGYYEALEAIAPGESPTTDPDKWAAITDLDRYIAYDQYGKQAIGKVLSLHPTNPRTGCGRGWHRPFTLSGSGIDVRGFGGNTVWITYQARPPQFTAENHDLAKAYVAGDIVFDPRDPVTGAGTGECYRARRAGTNEPVGLTAYWHIQRMPYLLSEYVQHGVASDFAEDARTKASLAAEAEESIQAEVNNELEQGVANTYSLADQARLGWGYCYSQWEMLGALVEVGSC